MHNGLITNMVLLRFWNVNLFWDLPYLIIGKKYNGTSKAFLHLKTIIFMISFLNVGLFWGLPYLIIAEAYSSILIALSIETMLTNYATILLYKPSSIYNHYARGGFTYKLRRVKYGKRIGNRVKRVKFIWLKRFEKVGDIYRGICNTYPFLKPPYICIKW